MRKPTGIFGLLAQFDEVNDLLDATHRARAAGYTKMSAYSPFPIEGLAEALGHPRTRLPILTLLGGVAGGAIGFAMMYYASVIGYPYNVGNRPLNSWPAFVPITFELTVLGAAGASFLGMLALNGLPHPYHPVFNVEEFKLASQSRFFLCIQARDPKFDMEATRQFLQSLPGSQVFEAPP